MTRDAPQDTSLGRATLYARATMQERARLFAARGEQAGIQDGPRRSAVILDIDGQGYAIDVPHVLRVTDPAWCAMPMRPDCPAGVRGVYGYGGNLYTVFDLSVLLGGAPMRAAGAMVLLRPASGLSVARFALLAGATTGVADIADASAGPSTPHPLAVLPDGRVVAALDPARLFAARHFGV